ncbi:hypothetical protein BTM36_06200 [Herbaspirillum sp. VT-16-41]|nr:hypothetical protein BTM36_06200 [Herbaspirillum sp. VT-16-41]
MRDENCAPSSPTRRRGHAKGLGAARANRREGGAKSREAVTSTLIAAGIPSQGDGREKTLYGIYRKMRNKHLTLSQGLDVYGFRVVADSCANCYEALGTLHSVYKHLPGKFKDYRAIPKLNRHCTVGEAAVCGSS